MFCRAGEVVEGENFTEMSNTPAPRTRQLSEAPDPQEGTSQASRDSVAQERQLAEQHIKARSGRMLTDPEGAVVAQVTAVSKRFLGTLALKRGKTPQQRAIAFVLALAALAAIVHVALSKQGWWG